MGNIPVKMSSYGKKYTFGIKMALQIQPLSGRPRIFAGLITFKR
jgi:hypothetical protein